MDTLFDSPRIRLLGVVAAALSLITSALALTSGDLLGALAHLTMGAGIFLRTLASSGRPTWAKLGTVLMFFGAAGMLAEVARKILRGIS